MAFDYFDNNLFDFSLGYNYIDLDSNSFNLGLGCFLDGCSSGLLTDIGAKNFVSCPDKLEEKGRC
jgi:hypothetical protein